MTLIGFVFIVVISVISGFHPRSCSTSIGHDYMNQSRALDFEEDSQAAEFVDDRPLVDRTIVPHETPPKSNGGDECSVKVNDFGKCE